MDCTYIGKTKRHFETRVEEHIRRHKHYIKSSVKDHILPCTGCKDMKIVINQCQTLKVCRSDYESKINEALDYN